MNPHQNNTVLTLYILLLFGTVLYL